MPKIGQVQPLPHSSGTPEYPALAVNRKNAAKLLGISERLLWSWTNIKRIPHVRVGARILYPVDALREWLRNQAQSASR